MSGQFISFLFLLFSYILCFFCQSWLLVWIFLEINTLSFCFLLKDSTSFLMNKSNEMSIKYLMVQSISSSFLLFFSLMMKNSSIFMKFFSVTLAIPVCIKLGSAPFHQWFINMTKQINHFNATVLMTWQKVIPVFLMIYLNKMILVFFIFLSGLVGSLGQFNKTFLLELMAYSSVFNLSWMILSVLMKMKTFFFFNLFYWSSVFFVMIMFNLYKMKNLKDSKNSSNVMILLIFGNLGGIPPFLGFVSKWIVLMEFLNLKFFLMGSMILLISSINLFIYFRIINDSLTLKTEILFTSLDTKNLFFFFVFLFFNSLGFIILFI